jgi:hypothetical protein
VAILKREQARINAEAADAESQIASDGEKLAQAKQIIGLALDLAKDRAASYRKARPDVRKMWSRAIFQTIRVRDGAIADFAYEEPLCLTPRCTHKGSMVDPRSSFVRFEADAERAVAGRHHPLDTGRRDRGRHRQLLLRRPLAAGRRVQGGGLRDRARRSSRCSARPAHGGVFRRCF